MALSGKSANIISILLLVFSIVLLLSLIIYFMKNTPGEFVTHPQFYVSLITVGAVFFSSLIAIWVQMSNIYIQISNRFGDLSKELGEMKGKLNQFISNHSKTKRIKRKR